MTISSLNRTAGPFVGDGTVALLAFSFKVFATTDVLVNRTNADGSQTTMALGSGYTVALNADQNTSPGGSVTVLTPASNFPAGSSIVITSAVATTQPLRLANNGPFLAEAIENALDRLTVLLQQAAVAGQNSLRVPDAAGVPALPGATARAGRVQVYGSAGLPEISGFTASQVAYAIAAAYSAGSRPTLTLEGLGAVGSGLLADAAADTAALAVAAVVPGVIIEGDPAKVYYITNGVQCAAGVVFRNCRFKIKLGAGGFSSVEKNTGRYDRDRVLLHWLSVDGGGLQDCEFFGDGGGDFICMPFAVTGGMSTRPFVMRGLNIIRDLPGVTGCANFNSIGAAGVRAAGSTLSFANIGTARTSGTATAYGGAGYWTAGGSVGAGDFTQVACLVWDTDLLSAGQWSSRCEFGTILGRNIWLEGAAYAKHGGQTDLVTLGGTGGQTNGCHIERIECIGPIDEPIDVQASNVEIGSIWVRNSRFVACKAVHGAKNLRVGRVHAEGVGRCAVGLFGSPAVAIDTDYAYIGEVTGGGAGDYILDSGTLQAGASGQATLRASGGAYHSVDHYYSAGPYGGRIIITGGTGAGQERGFSAYNGTTKVISGLSSAWSTTPDATSTYRIVPHGERCAVAVENDDIGAVTDCTVANIAFRDTGFLDYITRSNQSTAGRNNRLTVARDLGFQQRPALVASAGPTRTNAGPSAQGFVQMVLASDQPIATTSLTQVLFATKRIDTYDTPGAQGVQGAASDSGIRVRLPGLKTFTVKLGYLTWAAGMSATVSLYRAGALVQSKTFSSQSTGPFNADATFQRYHNESEFGGTANLYQIYVQHSAATSQTLSGSTATSTTEFTMIG